MSPVGCSPTGRNPNILINNFGVIHRHDTPLLCLLLHPLDLLALGGCLLSHMLLFLHLLPLSLSQTLLWSEEGREGGREEGRKGGREGRSMQRTFLCLYSCRHCTDVALLSAYINPPMV